jgi:hypothetical protein
MVQMVNCKEVILWGPGFDTGMRPLLHAYGSLIQGRSEFPTLCTTPLGEGGFRSTRPRVADPCVHLIPQVKLVGLYLVAYYWIGVHPRRAVPHISSN